MGLFERLFPARKEKIKAETYFKLLNGYTPTFANWGGKIYESGLVRAAIHAKASHASKMSVKIVGSAKKSLQTQLKLAPNEFQTWSQFLYRTATILENQCVAYIIPIIDRFGETSGIYCPLPQEVSVVQYLNTPYLNFKFSNGQSASIELAKVGILTKFQYKNDLTGDGNGALDQTMKLLDIQNQGIIEGTKNAATYRFMAQYGNLSFDDDLVKEQERFNNSVSQRGGLAILFPNTYKDIKQIDSKPFVIDAEQMRTIQENVFQYFGVNKNIIESSATPDQLDSFYSSCLEPFAIQLGEVLTKMLFTANEQAHGTKVIVASDRLQYMSVTNKIALITALGDRGMLTINEARELLNYAPIDGGDEMMPIRGEYYNQLTDGKEKEGEADGGTNEA